MYTALIIDDNPVNIQLLIRFLKLYHIEAIGAETGRAGFEMAKQHQPAIILTDLRMPDYTWNGYQTIKALKNDPQTNRIPIVAVTASGDLQAAHKAGCDDVLRRPFQIRQLKKIISQYIAFA